MKVFLRDIPFEGLSSRQTVSAQEIGLADENFVCRTPLVIDADFEKVEEGLIIKIMVRGTYELTCAACLEPVAEEREDEFELIFDTLPETEFVDYGDDIRQEMLMRLSDIVRCKKDCKGLCPTCGVNLNKTVCSCPPQDQQEGRLKIELDKKKKKQ